LGVAAAAGAGTLAIPVTGHAQGSEWVWTEPYAEGRVLKKVHIPCGRVRSKQACDLKTARARYVGWLRKENGCKRIDDPAKAARCLIAIANPLSNARNAYRYARRGFAINNANCLGIGAGGKDKMFPQFRCKLLLQDHRVAPSVNLNGDVVDRGKTIKYSARIDVYVIGKLRFRWKLAS
jgi:hypothetical protein